MNKKMPQKNLKDLQSFGNVLNTDEDIQNMETPEIKNNMSVSFQDLQSMQNENKDDHNLIQNILRSQQQIINGEIDISLQQNQPTQTNTQQMSQFFEQKIQQKDQKSENANQTHQAPQNVQPSANAPNKDQNLDQAVAYKEQIHDQKQVSTKNNNRKVLIICTGGTISMFPSEYGLKVRCGIFQNFLKDNPYLCDQDYTFFHSEDDFLITPLSVYNQRTWYKVHELQNPIDSTNMNVIYYDLIASIVEENYDKYDGFLILHGTDTMAYTASALSFMLENLSKTVIITGSQIPCSSMRNDGFNNLLCSITVCGHYTIPEVLVCFNDKLFRGNRCTKMDSNAMDSFDSPNYEPLAVFGINININWEKILKKDPSQKFQVHKRLSDQIAIIKFHPFISSKTLKVVLNDNNTRAIIIETYGAGNIPINRPELLQMLQQAYEQGKIIVNLSQCYRSNVVSIYETGKALLKVGVVCGWDCTIEAMSSKLAFLLSKNFSVDTIRILVQKNLRGELSPPIENDIFEFQQEHFLQALNDAVQSGSEDNIDILKTLILPNITCYLSKGGLLSSLIQLKNYIIDFSQGDYDDRTGLHLAAREGQLDCLKFLISECKDINIVDKFGRSPLYEACLKSIILHRQKQCIIELERAGAQVIGPKHQITALLMNAIKENDKDIFDIFHMAKLKDWNLYKTIDGRTFAHVAATFNNIEIIRFLKYQCKMNFDDKDRYGRTALDEAKKKNHKEICKILQ